MDHLSCTKLQVRVYQTSSPPSVAYHRSALIVSKHEIQGSRATPSRCSRLQARKIVRELALLGVQLPTAPEARAPATAAAAPAQAPSGVAQNGAQKVALELAELEKQAAEVHVSARRCCHLLLPAAAGRRARPCVRARSRAKPFRSARTSLKVRGHAGQFGQAFTLVSQAAAELQQALGSLGATQAVGAVGMIRTARRGAVASMAGASPMQRRGFQRMGGLGGVRRRHAAPRRRAANPPSGAAQRIEEDAPPAPRGSRCQWRPVHLAPAPCADGAVVGDSPAGKRARAAGVQARGPGEARQRPPALPPTRAPRSQQARRAAAQQARPGGDPETPACPPPPLHRHGGWSPICRRSTRRRWTRLAGASSSTCWPRGCWGGPCRRALTPGLF
jgi:hypothetical protein